VFFSGPPYRILDAWHHGSIEIVVSPAIMEEYTRVGQEIAAKFSGTQLGPALELLAVNADLVEAPDLPGPACRDRDDDKFLACAIVGKCQFIVTGDKDLLDMKAFRGVVLMSPRAFVDRFRKKERYLGRSWVVGPPAVHLRGQRWIRRRTPSEWSIAPEQHVRRH
jgi:putative PIN family toxin of toxin-antitoxin system